MPDGTDRHKHKPKSVRIPGGLLAWLGEQAAMEGRKPNAVIVAALEEYRDNHGLGFGPQPPRVPDHPPLPPPYRAPSPRGPSQGSACRHPADRVEAGECQDCGADVW